MISEPIRTYKYVALLAVAALSACGDAEQSEPGQQLGDAPLERSVGMVGYRAPLTRGEYLRMPDSVRLDGTPAGIGEARGVAVEVAVVLDGLQGDSIPLAASLHDGINGLPFVSRTIPLVPDAPRWRRQGWVWVEIPSAGSYYVQMALADSSGRSTSGPRTPTFAVD